MCYKITHLDWLAQETINKKATLIQGKLNYQMTFEEITLKEYEASKLAADLKSQLQMGSALKADESQIKLIIAGLGDQRGLIRRTFIESLGAIGNPAVPALREALLHHPNVTVRRSAAKALRLTGDPTALPDLLQALINDDAPVVQGSSVGSMAVFGEEAVKHLLKVLVDPNSTTMQCGLATWALTFIGAAAPLALLQAAQSQTAAIRVAAIAALGEQIQSLGDETARDLIINALDDTSWEVRAEATNLIGKLNSINSDKSLLVKKLSDTDSDVRKQAALSLMKLKAVEAIEDLEKTYAEEKDAEITQILKLVINQLKKEV